MFYEPIRYVGLKNSFELASFSLTIDGYSVNYPKEYCLYQGQIVFVTEECCASVSPRVEEAEAILQKDGYKKGEYFVPNQEKGFVEKLYNTINSKEYKWLKQMANLEKLNLAFLRAHKIANNKKIGCVEPDRSQIEMYIDVSEKSTEIDGLVYKCMLNKKLDYISQKNVGTYIRVDYRTVLVCDEYGRTFLIRFKECANEFINSLIDANYTKTLLPWSYIYSKKENAKNLLTM